MPNRSSSSKPSVALVTGANKGIGFEIARQLAAHEFHVFVGARDAQRGEAAAAKLASNGARVSFLLLDVNDHASVRAAAKAFAREADQLDVLVNNAAILEDRDGILDLSPELFERTMRTNVLGPIIVAQEFWPFLKRARGRIVNISSGAGALHDMDDYAAAYGISKAALNAVTRKLATVGRSDGIVVNSVCPGWVRTDMGGASAPRSVEQGADTAVWLATDAPRKITGRFLRDRREIDW